MEFRRGVDVLTSEGEHAGSLDEIVLNPQTKEMTHLVIRKGVLFTEDRLVPIDMVAKAGEEEIRLREFPADVENLPIFEETHYVPLDQDEVKINSLDTTAPPSYWYPFYPPGGAVFPAIERTERHIPEETVPLKVGAKVVNAEGDHVGNVEEVLTDPEADRATHFLISQGLLLKQSKLVPVEWVSDFGEDQIGLVVGSGILEDLPEYEG